MKLRRRTVFSILPHACLTSLQDPIITAFFFLSADTTRHRLDIAFAFVTSLEDMPFPIFALAEFFGGTSDLALLTSLAPGRIGIAERRVTATSLRAFPDPVTALLEHLSVTCHFVARAADAHERFFIAQLRGLLAVFSHRPTALGTRHQLVTVAFAHTTDTDFAVQIAALFCLFPAPAITAKHDAIHAFFHVNDTGGFSLFCIVRAPPYADSPHTHHNSDNSPHAHTSSQQAHIE